MGLWTGGRAHVGVLARKGIPAASSASQLVSAQGRRHGAAPGTQSRLAGRLRGPLARRATRAARPSSCAPPRACGPPPTPHPHSPTHPYTGLPAECQAAGLPGSGDAPQVGARPGAQPMSSARGSVARACSAPPHAPSATAGRTALRCSSCSARPPPQTPPRSPEAVDISQIDWTRPTAFVLGNEEKGGRCRPSPAPPSSTAAPTHALNTPVRSTSRPPALPGSPSPPVKASCRSPPCSAARRRDR
jgi:hypothetical protein